MTSRHRRFFTAAMKLYRTVTQRIREFEDALGLFGNVARRMRQAIIVSAISAAPLYIFVSIASLSDKDINALLDIVEIQNLSVPPKTLWYLVEPGDTHASFMPVCEDEYIGRHFARSSYGENIVIVNVFGETAKPVLLAIEKVLGIFFNISLPYAAATYLDAVRDPAFSQRQVGEMIEYYMSSDTSLQLSQEILGSPSILEACANTVAILVRGGAYVCPLIRVVVVDQHVLGAGLHRLCLTQAGDAHPRFRPVEGKGFWTSLKIGMGLLEVR